MAGIELSSRTEGYAPEKTTKDFDAEKGSISLDEEPENSPVEAVRMAVPITDDPTLPIITFRFWVLSFIFTALGAVITQYNFFRSTSATYSIFFVNLVTYSLGKAMARLLPKTKVSLFGYDFSLNPGPFNIKEHSTIGIAVNTGASAAYAVDILAATDLFLEYRINAIGSLLLIFTTQCVGYGMAGLMRKYIVYPAEMVWWGNLVQVVFYNTMHNTTEFKDIRLVFGWTRMKFFWVVCVVTFCYQLLPQWLFPLLMYFDWGCWIQPFNRNFWAIFSSVSGGGVLSLTFDWSTIGGATLYFPFYAQINSLIGMIFNYWIILPIFWMNNVLGTRTMNRPLTSKLFYENGTYFSFSKFQTADHNLDEAKYEASGAKANMAPLYALGFFTSFIALAGCCSHIAFFHGRKVWKTWRSVMSSKEEDIHTKMMKAYPEVPQLWYAIFYILMAALSLFTVEYYKLQLPWWGLLIALLMGFVLTLPIGVMNAVTGYGPGLNVITELVCGYMLPGKPIANMVFKCYGYMAMYQCTVLLQDLKLGHYMKIPPRSLFAAQFWGTIVGGVFNFATQLLIIDSQRDALNGNVPDKNGLWTGQRVQTYWGSGLIYGALGPARMFALNDKYGWVYLGFLIGFVIPAIQWVLSKKMPHIQWQLFNISIFAGGMGAFPNGYSMGVTMSLIVCIIFQYYIARYHKGWWNRYTFILAAALDTGAAFTGLLIFLFLGGGISPKLVVNIPSWWGNYYAEDGSNAPYLSVDRCGAASGPADPTGWTVFNPV
ncbi:hypothetical protein DFQ27_001524 [Actinomortierella ambigua]|uniref:OPT oligopeptide transporter protein-domain-containing protein n=1 Tax=Actinomortierella ambigua TaxID=1343610 RepID=A0A9P6QA45_9FUNG|nr:hypothetical protein DFQ27_001524 [Actinomortierella ambigua]